MADANKPLDFSSTNPRRSILARPSEDRPGKGDIPYIMAYPDYTEVFSYGAGGVQKPSFFVKWSDSDDFVDFSLGFTNWVRADPSRFHRVLPMKSEYQNNFFADTCELTAFGLDAGSVRSDVGVGNWMAIDWARYAVEFRSRKYDMATDAQLDDATNAWNAYGCKELGRFTERIVRYASQELRVAQYKLDATDPATGTPTRVPDVGFTPFYKAEVVYIWHNVPYDAVPIDAMNACSLCVNQTAFDLKPSLDGATLVPRWPAGTMLFKGLGQELDPYPGPRGDLLVDVHYLFGYQAKGWNFYPNPKDPSPTAAWWPITRHGVAGGVGLYGQTDFRPLFKPRTS